MDTIHTVADMYFDICSAPGHKYAGVTLPPDEYSRLLAHSHANFARAMQLAESVHIDLESRKVSRMIVDAARKGLRAMSACAPTDADVDTDTRAQSRELSVFASVFRANINANTKEDPKIALALGTLVMAAIERKQLSFASIVADS